MIQHGLGIIKYRKELKEFLLQNLRKRLIINIFDFQNLFQLNLINLKSVDPIFPYITNIANNINNDPAKVYKNSKKAALILLALAPQIPTIKNKGIKTLSKNI